MKSGGQVGHPCPNQAHPGRLEILGESSRSENDKGVLTSGGSLLFSKGCGSAYGGRMPFAISIRTAAVRIDILLGVRRPYAVVSC
jgi:hypothetical protein